MRKYNTEAEAYELSRLEQLLPKCEIVNPNGLVSNMEESYALVDTCDALGFTEHKGHIGKGVYCEIAHALKSGKRVGLLCDERFHTITSMSQIEVIDIDWAIFYARVRKAHT